MNNPIIKDVNGNLSGRDFVIGDLHGCYDELIALLNFVQFDIETDRVFCVGDLIHRGPFSEKCLKLLQSKNQQGNQWFFSTLGNHDYYGGQKSFPNENVNLNEYKESLSELPLIYKIKHPIFEEVYIVHAEVICDSLFYQYIGNHSETSRKLNTYDYSQEIINMLNSSSYILSEKQRKETIWSRYNHKYFLRNNDLDIVTGNFQFLFNKNKQKITNKLKIFCGHSIVPFPMIIGHQIYCDTGACFGYYDPQTIKSLAKWGSQFFSLSMIEINTGKTFSCVTSKESVIKDTEKRQVKKYKRGDIIQYDIQLYDDIWQY